MTTHDSTDSPSPAMRGFIKASLAQIDAEDAAIHAQLSRKRNTRHGREFRRVARLDALAHYWRWIADDAFAIALASDWTEANDVALDMVIELTAAHHDRVQVASALALLGDRAGAAALMDVRA